MGDDLGAFVGAGIRHYADAVATTNRFVSELQNMLAAALENDPDRTAWQRKPGALRKGSGTIGTPWISASQQVVVRTHPNVDAVLVVGVWWRPDGPVVYTHFNDGPEHCRRFPKREEPAAGIRWLKSGSLYYFVCAPSDPVSIAADVRKLLDHVHANL